MSQEKTPHASLELEPGDSPSPATLPAPVTSSSAAATSVPKDFFVIPVRTYLRHNPEKPAPFGLFMNIVFAIATTFSTFSSLVAH